MTTILRLKKGEAKVIPFFSTTNGNANDLTGAEFAFIVKTGYDVSDSTLINKTTSDFDNSEPTTGIVSLPLSSTDLDISAGNYKAELKIEFSGDSIDKSQEIEFIVEDSLF